MGIDLCSAAFRDVGAHASRVLISASPQKSVPGGLLLPSASCSFRRHITVFREDAKHSTRDTCAPGPLGLLRAGQFFMTREVSA